MKLRTVTLLAMAALGAPAGRLSSQAPHAVTARAVAGRVHGDGGRYRDRELNSFSMGIDVGLRPGRRSGPLVGFGFGYYKGAGEAAVHRCVPDLNCPGTASFPDVKVGYVDMGWQRVTRDFSVDLVVQPTVAFVSRPDIIPVGLGGGVTVGRRLIGSFGVQIGTSATYLPALEGVRIGLRQLTIGLRSW